MFLIIICLIEMAYEKDYSSPVTLNNKKLSIQMDTKYKENQQVVKITINSQSKQSFLVRFYFEPTGKDGVFITNYESQNPSQFKVFDIIIYGNTINKDQPSASNLYQRGFFQYTLQISNVTSNDGLQSIFFKYLTPKDNNNNILFATEKVYKVCFYMGSNQFTSLQEFNQTTCGNFHTYSSKEKTIQRLMGLDIKPTVRTQGVFLYDIIILSNVYDNKQHIGFFLKTVRRQIQQFQVWVAGIRNDKGWAIGIKADQTQPKNFTKATAEAYAITYKDNKFTKVSGLNVQSSNFEQKNFMFMVGTINNQQDDQCILSGSKKYKEAGQQSQPVGYNVLDNVQDMKNLTCFPLFKNKIMLIMIMTWIFLTL